MQNHPKRSNNIPGRHNSSATESKTSSSTLRSSCEAIWGCQHAAQAIPILQSIHQSLVDEDYDPLDYDPSETFLAIQGAALRFHPSQIIIAEHEQTTSSSPEENHQEEGGGVEGQRTQSLSPEEKRSYWEVTEEALWAAAALACVSVGPAWRSQSHRRKLWLAQRSKHGSRFAVDQEESQSHQSFVSSSEEGSFGLSGTAPKDITAFETQRSFSPVTASVQSISLHEALQSPYPTIPEVLPAAMLRFATSFLSVVSEIESEFDSLRKIVVAQRNLVLAICCESPSMTKNTEESSGKPSRQKPSVPKSTEWLIPGSHALVGDMMTFWLKVATRQLHKGSSDEKTRPFIDWWLTLGVTRACTDLIGTGWRPLPSTNVGATVVNYLLDIAQRGIVLLDGLGGKINREHRLAASSSSAEAIGALASLGSRSLIPVDSQLGTAEISCRLHVISGRIKAKASTEGYSVVGSSASETSKRQQEREIFITQIESCFADTADFLWVLFATVSSSKTAISALLRKVDAVDWNSEKCVLDDEWDATKRLVCMEAGTGIRMISAALWGRPPDVIEIPHLRSYWGKMLTIIRDVAKSTHVKVGEEMHHGDHKLSPMTRDMLSLALDLIVALGNFIDRELVGGSGSVLDLEWEYFLAAFEEAFLPWLSYSKLESETEEVDTAQAMPIMERAQLEIESLLLRIGALLDKCVRIEGSILHSIVTYENQRKLFLLIMQKSIPHMDQTDAELLGLSTVRAWSKFGFFPFRYQDWAGTASELITEAFTMYEDGTHVHSARVRLEALRALTFREQNIDDRLDGVPVSDLSLLDMTRDMREMHHPLVSNTIIPVVKFILMQGTDDQYPTVPRTKKLCTIDDLSSSSSSNDTFDLEKYAIRLIGRLARSRSGDRQDRLLLIEILRSTALDNRWTELQPKDDNSLSDVSGQHERSSSLESSVRLEAIRELEVCLAVPFAEAVTLHEIVPPIVDALREILSTYTGPPSESDGDFTFGDLHERAVLALAAVIPLARLRSSEAGKVSLLARRNVIQHIPSSIAPFVPQSLNDIQPGASHPPTIAPFIEVNGSPRVQLSGHKMVEKTKISLEEIFSCITAALGSSRAARLHVDLEIASIFVAINVVCSRALASLLLSGFRLQNPELLENFIYAASIECGEIIDCELLAQIEAMACISQVALAERMKLGGLDCDESDPWRTRTKLTDFLLDSFLEKKDSQLAAIGRAISSMIRTLRRPCMKDKGSFHELQEIFEQMAKYLHLDRSKSQSDSTEENCLSSKALEVITGTVEEILQIREHTISVKELRELIVSCLKLIAFSEEHGFCYSSYASLRCLVTAIDRLPQSEAGSTDFVTSVMDATQELFPSNPSAINHFSLLDRTFLTVVVSELLEERSKYSDDEYTGDPFMTSYFYHHESLAIELDKMERFIVEKSLDGQAEVKSSWLCGDAILLTCRLGSSDSRYRGWMELVVRTPVSRKRLMVRMASRISIENPDYPILLWDPELPEGIQEMPKALPREYDGSDDVMKKYHALVSRFDEVIAPSASDSIAQSGSHISEEEADAAETKSLPIQPKPMDQNSEFDEVSLHLLQGATCIHDWLVATLRDEDDIQDVELALHKAKFDKPLLHNMEEAPPSKEIDPLRRINKSPVHRLKEGQNLDRAIALLDRTSPSTTHKFALLYAGPRRIGSAQRDSESILLQGLSCSPLFYRFADKLGPMVQTRHLKYFSAGLDTSRYQSDGEFTRVWVGDAFAHLAAARNIVVYHTVNLMPDVLNNRKRHVGNDCIHIVFVDKDSPVGEDIDLQEAETEPLVSGHFGFVTIYVSMLQGSDVVRVCTRIRSGLSQELRAALLNMVGNDIIPFDDAADYVRGVAIRADIACRSALDNLAPASNCHERYRLLRGMKRHEIKNT
jgi:hypothetical protein